VRQLVDDRGSIFASFKPGSAEERSKPQPGLKRMRRYAKFGGELIPISMDDLTEMRHQANGRRTESSLIVLGFKPKHAIPFHHTLAPAYLIYPSSDEEMVKGSWDAFVELHASMKRKKVVAIGEVIHRIQGTSRLVAIYPIDEVMDETEEGAAPRQKRPPGMVVTTLPFEDDMRALEPDAASEFDDKKGDLELPGIVKSDVWTKKEEDPDQLSSTAILDGTPTSDIASEELVTAAMELICRQKMEGMELGEHFENAPLTEFFNYLESVALEMPVSGEEEEFDTRLDDEMVLEAARQQIDTFQRCLPEDVEKQKSSGARKRKLVADDSGLDWEELYRTDALEDCKVPELKKYLRSVGEPVSGNKASLVLRITQHLQQTLERKTEGVAVKMET
jgi:hypothetical protein